MHCQPIFILVRRWGPSTSNLLSSSDTLRQNWFLVYSRTCIIELLLLTILMKRILRDISWWVILKLSLRLMSPSRWFTIYVLLICSVAGIVRLPKPRHWFKVVFIFIDKISCAPHSQKGRSLRRHCWVIRGGIQSNLLAGLEPVWIQSVLVILHISDCKLLFLYFCSSDFFLLL